MRKVAFTAAQTAAVVETTEIEHPIGPLEVRGRTLASLTSPGTEINHGFLGQAFPYYPGYASVYEVQEVGAEVTDLKAGDVVFGTGGHTEYQSQPRDAVVLLPEGLAPEVAVFARLMAVTMTTLATTTARPPSRVLVSGLGPVGNLAAQIFQICGFQVTSVDPVEARRVSAVESGLKDVRASLQDGDDVVGKIALHLECSGHEQAVLDGINAVRQRGEVVLVGVPWRKRTELSAFDILTAVFHKYAVVRSGWEWELPEQPVVFRGNFRMENYAAALSWLAEGKIKVDNLATCYSPHAAQEVYSGLLNQSLLTPSAVFDWRQL